MAIALPKALSRPPVDALSAFQRQEQEIRAKKAKAEARLLELDQQAISIQWDQELDAATINKRLAQIGRDQTAARLDVSSASDALTRADAQRALAHRASAELALEELRLERRKLLQATKLDAERLEPLVTELNAVNARIRAAATLDHDLRMRQIAEMRRGGIPEEGSVAAAISAGDGVWLLNGVEQDLEATARDLENAGRDR